MRVNEERSGRDKGDKDGAEHKGGARHVVVVTWLWLGMAGSGWEASCEADR